MKNFKETKLGLNSLQIGSLRKSEGWPVTIFAEFSFGLKVRF